MVKPVCVPADSLDFQGFGEDDAVLLRHGDSSHPRLTRTTMVRVRKVREVQVMDYESDTSTETRRYSTLQGLPHMHSRVELVRQHYKNKYGNSPEVVKLLCHTIRESSTREYERMWKDFSRYLDRERTWNNINLQTVLNYLCYLYHDRRLKPGTIAHYRSAITKPLRLVFGVELDHEDVTNALKAMWIGRPNEPFEPPNWDLNVVLRYIENYAGPFSNEFLLRKSAFLILLATGWRISELQACVRSPEYCKFSTDSLSLRPHPSFMAKNETPTTRWHHLKIIRLTDEQGTTNVLCPVRALETYINLNQGARGKIYLNDDNSKELSIFQLSTHVCRLILRAEPNARAKVHDVRKFAASTSAAESFNLGKISEAIGWKNVSVFVKSYLFETPPLRVLVSLPHNHNRQSKPSRRGTR